MDLVKIGRYIAGKRKALDLTQRQLAEKLGMSDKSVSKWERGICLPDVSVYPELCGVLGISVNEFLAGEDIGQEDIARKSEDNLIQVAADSKRRQKRLKRIIAVLLAAVLIALSAAAAILQRASRPRSFIAPIDRDSPEMKTAELLSGVDGALLYRYRTDESFQRLTIFLSEYRSGRLVDKTNMTLGYGDTDSPSEGMIVIVPDFENFTVKLIVTGGGTKYSTAIPILEDAAGREYYGRSASQIPGETDIRYDEEQGLAALIYGKDVLHVLDIREMENGNTGERNDYVYYFSFRFDREA